MNPYARYPTSPVAIVRSIWGHRYLIGQMARRDVLGRYSGSLLGLAWSVVTPLLMLAIYTFVFSYVFNARWAGQGDSKVQFALILFSGLLVHGYLSEVLSRAPQVIVSNTNFVKKVIFPLECLPVIAVVTALFHTAVGVGVFIVASLVLSGPPPWTIVLLPIVLLPLVVLSLGAAWLLAALGVYVRDIGQVIGLLMSVLLFMSPIFYPLSSLPAWLQPWMQLNPLTFIIEQVRRVAIWGELPDWRGWCLYMLVAALICWLGFYVFQRTRRGFSDVL